MLIARFKTKSRKEKTKYVSGNKKKIKFKNRDYHIKPSCIYSAYIMGFFRYDCIDFVEGDTYPVGYYDNEYRNQTKKNVDCISDLAKKLTKGLGEYATYILILSGVACALSGICLYYIYTIAEKIGV